MTVLESLQLLIKFRQLDSKFRVSDHSYKNRKRYKQKYTKRSLCKLCNELDFSRLSTTTIFKTLNFKNRSFLKISHFATYAGIWFYIFPNNEYSSIFCQFLIYYKDTVLSLLG